MLGGRIWEKFDPTSLNLWNDALKQFSPSCEHNKDDILPVLTAALPRSGVVLEIGSGTGQHAAYFSASLQHLVWQPTDLACNLPSIRAWCAEAGLANIRSALELDLLREHWPVSSANAVVCINTTHIVSWLGVQKLFAGVGRVLAPGGVMFVYGAYRYASRPLEPSNEEFDRWLKARDAVSGVRDFEAVNYLAAANRLQLVEDRAMPGNNRSIWWRKAA